MRLIAAVIYIIIGMGFLAKYLDESSAWMAIPGMFFLIFSSAFIFNEGFIRLLKRQSYQEHIDELIKKGKATKKNYEVLSAISFEDLNTGSYVHLLQIKDSEFICLYGQYLYDYEPISDDPEINQARKFPTRSFSVVMKSKNSEIIDIAPGKEVLEPTVINDPNIQAARKLGIKLDDGELLSGYTKEQLIEVLDNDS